MWPFSKKSKCSSRNGKHDFGQWEVIEKGEVGVERAGRDRAIGNYLVQERACKICGFRELNLQESELK